MSLRTDLSERIRSLFFRARDEREHAEELAFHLEMAERAYRQNGLPPEEARRRARLDLGGRAQVMEEVRDARGTHLLDQLSQDLRYAVRSFRKSRGFAFATILILALGIGANTATFTLVNALLLTRLPVAEPDRLVTLGNTRRTNSLHEGTPRADLASVPLYQEVRAGTHTLAGLYATGRTGRLDVLVSGSGPNPGEPEHPRGRLVSGSFFAVLGVPALIGRTFSDAEDRGPGTGPVVVLSHPYWTRRFGADRGAVGRTITINGAPFTIIGVTPRGFSGDLVGQAIDLWIPLTMQPVVMAHRDWLTDRNMNWLLIMGRLAPGVTLEQARAELTGLVSRSLLDQAEAGDLSATSQLLREQGVPIGPGALGFSYYRSSLAPTLALFSVVVALVLLVVAANVANLMLARGAARVREMSIRLSLGAARRRVIGQLLTESLLLAVAGAGFGLLVARAGTALLLRLAGQGTALPLAVPMDGRVLGFTAGIALVTVVLFGVVPALRSTRIDLAGILRASSRSVAGSGRFRLNRALVVAQVALSTVLLVGTGMIVRSLTRLTGADLGLARDQVVVADLDPTVAGYVGPRLAQLRRDLTDRIARVPGVAAVSYSENGLFSGTESGSYITVPGFTASAASDTSIAYDDVGAGYFEAVGARLLLGRGIEERDGPAGPAVAVVNQGMAQFYFGTASPIGRQVHLDGQWYEIVGVVADVKGQAVRGDPERRLYIPMEQLSAAPGRFRFEVRTAGDPAQALGPIREAIRAVDPDIAILGLEPLNDLVSESLVEDRMTTQVIGALGAIALGLAALGLYGVMAYATVRRFNEFGLRMALGAGRSMVGRMVVGEALRLVALGAVLGIPAAMAAARLLRSRWYGIESIDLRSAGFALVVMVLSGAIAAYLPALRASRVPPMVAIQSE